ncbi:MAG TPA: diaminopimelate decarboxylase [Acidimicrobiia bacterium]|nr:diaminopimelate decarboxylase [Acidimicrobiia bacterium]
MTSAPLDPSLVPPAVRDADVEALAEQFGTPLFLYDEGELRRRCRAYVAAFGADRVAYASKAFLCTAMAQLVAEEGLHLDVATGGELHVAVHAGFPPGRLVVHGNNKSDDELDAALAAGSGRIVADSFDELDRLEQRSTALGVTPTVLVRTTPGVEAHTHEYIETGTEDSKFGFTVTGGIARDAARRVAASAALRFGGLHCHIGSQIQRLDPWGHAVAALAAVAAELDAPVHELSLGGGLGARYLAEDPPLEIDDYAAALRAAVEGHWPARLASPELLVEPGRSIAAPCAVTLYRVGTVKEIPGVGTYVAVDGGMSDNPRPVLYGAGYEAYLPDRVAEARPLRCRVVGKHCEQGDVIVADAALPAGVGPGDLLATPATGAYGYSMASNYNKVPRPAVVFLRGGEARVVVRRETFDDLVRLDVVGD